MNLIKSFRFVAMPLVLGSIVLLSGCKTIDSTSVTNFASSVASVKTQADAALNSAATLTRNVSIAYAASQPTLKDENFAVTPTADTISQWDNELTAMANYAQNLAVLLSPNAEKNFDTAATNLFDQLNLTANEINAASKAPNSQDFTLFATALTQLGGAILQARANATAVKVAAATDATITNLCAIMANEIGADATVTPGLRKTLNETVTASAKSILDVAFLNAKTPADKLAVAQQYADLLAKQDAEDQILAALHHSLLLLGAAHHTLAQGQPASVQSSLNVIASEIQQANTLYAQFSSITNK